MILHFSPSFDEEHFVEYSDVMFDERVVGCVGLLSVLELRLGLVREYDSEVERLVKYYDALRLYLMKNPELFIRGSFEVDSLGVAAKLLAWRDELIFAGWRGDTEGVSDKITLLSDIEKRFTEPRRWGICDRWQLLLGELQSAEIRDIKLVVHTSIEYLHPTICRVINLLEERGAEVEHRPRNQAIATQGTNLYKVQRMLLTGECEPLNADDNSLQILHFKDYYTALEYSASMGEEAVYINGDNKAYDSIQYAFGLPQSGSMATNANPQTLQLFKLGVLLHIAPLNIYTLLSYLQVNTNPVPSNLRRTLQSVIAKEEGVGNKQWTLTIEEYEWQDDTQKQSVISLLPTSPSTQISRAAIIAYCKALDSWANNRRLQIHTTNRDVSSEDLDTSHLVKLCEMCRAMVTVIGCSSEEYISPQELKSLVLAIYTPISYTLSTPKMGSSMVISSGAAMVDSAPKIIYMDCQNPTVESRMYSDISAIERKLLTNAGVEFWSSENQINLSLESYKLSIFNAREQATLIYCDEVRGSQTTQHPLIAELMVRCKDIEKIIKENPCPKNIIAIDKETSPREEQESFEFPVQYAKLIEPRTKESYSSMSLLQDMPFDYLFKYIANIRSREFAFTGALNRVMGNVAHRYVEELVAESTDNDTLSRLHTHQYRERIERIIGCNGAIILLPENRCEYEQFLSQLDTSIMRLLNIIKALHLQIIGCEIVESYYEPRIKCKVEATMDMLLRDADGNTVVFDMKWTSSRKWYRALIENNEALQLELYRNVVNRSKRHPQVSWVGYFLLSFGELYTTHKHHSQIGRVVTLTPKSEEDIYQTLLESYNTQLDQFRAGVIEQGEESDNSEYNQFKGHLK